MCIHASCFSHVRLFVTSWTVARQAPHPWESPGKNIGVSCHTLLQGIFLTQVSNPSFLMCPVLEGGFFTTSATCGALFPHILL